MTADCVRCPCPVDFYALGQNAFRWGLLPDAGGEVAECSSTLAIRCFCYRWQCSLALSILLCWPLYSLSLSRSLAFALFVSFSSMKTLSLNTQATNGEITGRQMRVCEWVRECVCMCGYHLPRQPFASSAVCEGILWPLLFKLLDE